MRQPILLVIAVVLIMLGIAMFAANIAPQSQAQIGLSIIEYSYDSVHDVGIWVYRSTGGAGMVVLPGDRIANKGSPMIGGPQ